VSSPRPRKSWSLTSPSGEYPAGSVACAESTGELKEGHRNRWFVMFTNVQIDIGFIVSAIVPMIVRSDVPPVPACVTDLADML
jgi:hypothetical protein